MLIKRVECNKNVFDSALDFFMATHCNCDGKLIALYRT